MSEFVGEMCNHFTFFMIICYVDVGRVIRSQARSIKNLGKVGI